MTKENRRRDHRIQVRTTKEEYDRIIEKSKASNSLNDYMVRMALKGKVIMPSSLIDRNTAKTLAIISNNSNQIAYSLNKAEMNILNRRILNRLRENMALLQETLDRTRLELQNRLLQND